MAHNLNPYPASLRRPISVSDQTCPSVLDNLMKIRTYRSSGESPGLASTPPVDTSRVELVSCLWL
jgi:hypothetical protein